MVILVLIFHSGASYGSAVKFWPFHDNNPSLIIDLFMLLGDVFMMSVLFFVAGYFALPTLQRNGTWDFIKGKLRRLGIPWIIITIFLLPALDFIHYFVQHGSHTLPVRTYFEHWTLSIKKIATFHVGWMDMSAYWDMTEKFNQRYLWFISLLLLFFVLFVVIYHINKKWIWCTRRKNQDTLSSKKSIYKSLLVLSILNTAFFALTRFLFYPDFMSMGWFSLGNIIQFQLGKLTIYCCYFGLGVYAYSREWFADGADFGKAWKWGMICFCLFGLNMLILKSLTSTDAPSLTLRFSFTALYPTWALTFLGFFLSLFSRHFNHSTRFNRELATNSYNMYLIHYIFPFTLPLLIRLWGGPTIIKFGILSLFTILMSYTFSRYVLKPFPKYVMTGLVGLSILSFIVL
jgi:hypothetical protein